MAAEEIIAGPLTLWVAPVGTAFPTIATAEAAFDAAWEKIGTSGTRNYDDDGVTLNMAETVEEWIPAGGTLPRMAIRTEEQCEFTVKVADMTIQQLKRALNGNTVTEDGGADTTEISLYRGLDITDYALLCRGKSPYDAAGIAQWQVPRCYQSSEPEIEFVKGNPASYELTFRALDPEGDEANFLLIVEGQEGS